MFYRCENEAVNMNEVQLLKKDFLLNEKKWLIHIFMRGGRGAFQFTDMKERDRVFDEMLKVGK